MKNYLKPLLALLLFSAINSNAGQIEVVTVTSNGFGENEAEALSEAVINAISQVNGEAIASSMKLSKRSISSTDGNTLSEREIEKEISRKTSGVVKSWRKVSVEKSNAGFLGTVTANIVVLKQSEQLKRIKLAIVPRDEQLSELNKQLISNLVGDLTSSRKFALIDRNNSEAIKQQIDKIVKSDRLEDKVRVNSEVAPDYIITSGIKLSKNKSEREVIEARIEVIDYATRQVKFSEKSSITYQENSGSKRLNSLSKKISRNILDVIYPPIVIGYDGSLLTIGQGNDYFNVGNSIEIYELKSKLKDPYTDEFIGYEKKLIGNAVITESDKRISVAKVDGSININNDLLIKKLYQVKIKEGVINSESLGNELKKQIKSNENDDDY